MLAIANALKQDGFAFLVPCERAPFGSVTRHAGWPEFAASWNELPVDTAMADGGRYRRRRHAVFSSSLRALHREPARPHYQRREYNPLNGGVDRWFAPVRNNVASNPVFERVVLGCARVFADMIDNAAQTWSIEAHQFRIEAAAGPGLPTPEGVHRDGVDGVLIAMIRRENVTGGETQVFRCDGSLVAHRILQNPFEAVLLDDRRVLHGATPVLAQRFGRPAFRDVLVLTYRKAGISGDGTVEP
jgi:hypothetical protein